MIEEEIYLKEKKLYESKKQENDNFLIDHFVPLLRSFNPNFEFKFTLKEIKPKNKSGYIIFSYPTKNYYTDSLFVNFEVVHNQEVKLSYTEDSIEKSYSEMVTKSKLYKQVIDIFNNFNIEKFNKLISDLLRNNEEFAKTKREFLNLEKKYFQGLNQKYQKAFLSLINRVDEKKALNDFEDFVQNEIDEILEYRKNQHKIRRSNKKEFFSFWFDLENILFEEIKIVIELDHKNDKPIYYLCGKKSSRKKCLELIKNQFYYKDNLINNFNDFKKIEVFKKENFDSYSSWECSTKISKLVKPFLANLLAQDF